MKTLRTLSAVGLLALLTACGSTQTSTTDTQTITPNRGKSNTEITSAGKAPTRQSSTVSANSDTTRNNAAATKAEMEKMYTALDMNDDQISQFNTKWQTEMNSWSRSNRNNTMNSFERTETQDKIMKGILNDTQFVKYQQWARDNADKNARN
ncbi:hypothetical protein Aeqsu_1660 [Aequorivita sublithincola DSM 14238]|uniref:Lipoprotein n=1 Tax=Aequorivita sublithincola (strain DSM 14238 / LMG 21431 / ACAM 643 / 9-3) TaxID=746697 RepID=I3YVX5_AEQSU|nr:hypothetical protein [Aequorivita sublithincola]AFL81143.1 hypothetical protein Aeqsu_1660 [Aequorivita sublithincola DSM 14238]